MGMGNFKSSQPLGNLYKWQNRREIKENKLRKKLLRINYDLITFKGFI